MYMRLSERDGSKDEIMQWVEVWDFDFLEFGWLNDFKVILRKLCLSYFLICCGNSIRILSLLQEGLW